MNVVKLLIYMVAVSVTLILLAIAPNASSSIICGGTSPSIEPYRANVFTHKTLSVLIKLGINTWNDFLKKGKD